jgi:glycolate oxidase iron-sulfur subunit
VIPKDTESAYRTRFGAYLRTLDCVHCGLCLPTCPTHRISLRESDSPRGRIYLMRAHAEGRTEVSREAGRHLDLCIACRNCETVCPSGIRMGEMVEAFRDERRRRDGRGLRAWPARFLLRSVVPHRGRLSALSDLLRFAERIGARRVFRAAARRISPRLASLEALVPPIPPRAVRAIAGEAAALGGVYRAPGKARARVGLFLGCISSQWYAEVHRATIRVLLRNGCDVVVPAGQTCCGALHRHAGYLDDAAALLERNAEAFGGLGIDAVAVNAAGCGAALKEPPPGSPGLGVPVRDICELLDEIGIVPPTSAIPRRVVHHPACHLVHAQRVPAAVVEGLLRRIPGLTLVPLADAELCCGAGGIYNVLHPTVSAEVLRAKVDAVLASGAEIVATANPGCWLQIRAGLAGHGIPVLHPVELLDRSY